MPSYYRALFVAGMTAISRLDPNIIAHSALCDAENRDTSDEVGILGSFMLVPKEFRCLRCSFAQVYCMHS